MNIKKYKKNSLTSKNNKSHGITLIALIITIIVLLILAGVVLNLILGEKSIFKTAEYAVKNYTDAQNKELADLDLLDKYLQGNGNKDDEYDFENNGIDKSHDGAKYSPITTDDGMWTIYKDIDTQTKKVNVYVESKYYRPSFEQFVLEKYYLNSFLYTLALPIYSFSDLSDAAALALVAEQSIGDQSFVSHAVEKEINFGVGPTMHELLESVGVNDVDLYKEAGKELIEQIKSGELYLEPSNDMLRINSMFNLYFEPSFRVGPEMTLENLRRVYNGLYGDKANLTISEEEKNEIYKIELPDGSVEEIKGEFLYDAKFRYTTTKNGDIQIKIATDKNEAQTINYTGVTNIGDCFFEEDGLVYSYNCFGFLDVFTNWIINWKLLVYGEDYKINYEDAGIYRFNLDRLGCLLAVE